MCFPGKLHRAGFVHRATAGSAVPGLDHGILCWRNDMARCSTRFLGLRANFGRLFFISNAPYSRADSPNAPCVGTQALGFKSPPMHRRFLNGADEILAANGDGPNPPT